ncbi:hypothetical protein [Anaerosacchariphilus polymeriproducens]|uniref:Uncharacterized protein n=1 Tax=Anaerosacchariphilus polymeriproducens TaxID=1812858 RepID=A0A371AS63_9FIRM|nr:hypothetical protein [Anaerosacchariphilus polymeriproducens]RDU22407.1 hypothetical protein DWV06_14020 [Anaerosacchariphilus polymeriproducens]
MNTKSIPAIISLLAGLVTCVVMFQQKYTDVNGMKTLFMVLIIFYGAGLILQFMLNKVFNPAPKKEDKQEMDPDETSIQNNERIEEVKTEEMN